MSQVHAVDLDILVEHVNPGLIVIGDQAAGKTDPFQPLILFNKTC